MSVRRPVSFALWLGFAFVAVTSVAMGSVWVLASVGAARDQRALVESQDEAYLRQVIGSLEGSYATNRSWAGAQILAGDLVMLMPRRQVIPGPPSAARSTLTALLPRPRRLVIRDMSGKVVADASTDSPGREPAPVRPIAPLRFEGRDVGTLSATMPVVDLARLEAPPDDGASGPVNPNENLVRALVGGATIGGIAAIVIGAAVLRPLAMGIEALRRGATRIASGDLGARVAASGAAELRELAGAFNHLAESLERQEEARRRLVADIAHDLRTPVSVIRGTVDAMLDGVYDPADPAHLRSVRDEADRLGRMVNDLRALSLADAGRLNLDRSPVDPAALVSEACVRFGARATDGGIRLTADVAPDLPVIYGDPARLAQVLGNLIENALRHAPHGGTVTVSARPAASRHGVAIEVADDGPGIPASAIPHLFDRFYRVEASRSPGGSGLGLAIVRTLVEAHGGTVSASNRDPRGASFEIWLPAA